MEHLTTGALIALYVSLRYRRDGRPEWLPTVTSWWHARLCAALGIEISVRGRLEPGCLLVANHISWLDIPIIGGQGEIGFLSKAEVRTWPLIGWMAEIAGTLFIARGGNQTLNIASRIAGLLASGRTLVIFPEGTTTDGSEVLRFHPRLFGIAQDAGPRIQPVAIGYHQGSDPRPETRAAYIGEDTLVASLWRILRHPNLVADIQLLEPIQADANESRRALAERTHAAILGALDPVRGERKQTPEETPNTCIEEMDLEPRPAFIP
ncbi:lysophospholipid acyltransferase family protein [Imhoffiella purpurea]|uniref:1-acyl-sn-glycerol-3-phosphate acyltransferase n=1 Tax=Imhoffiella purpurea TaxID=1249627 RepID=W9VEQ9_9GAMM|nr:lysophospholipid acyltransferase family protein [Imhoffiella purpurea]EXJ15471.1 1-acyl-sn-glycerol-3-phosphate acyltransferase [Imhoffiella purpurea]